LEDKDGKLVHRAKAGSEEAFEELVRSHEKMVYHLALRMTGNPEDASDLTQEAFISAFRALPGFKGESSFSTWIYRLATNACIDFLRREKRRQTVSLVAQDEDGEQRVLELPDPCGNPVAELEQKELREAIHRGMDQLSPEHRRILLLREISGLNYQEIAESLGLEEGTVKSRIARARLRLREILMADRNFSGGGSSKSYKE
jgi:RNA polymerase sigma-70 factor (ECF subfamily)